MTISKVFGRTYSYNIVFWTSILSISFMLNFTYTFSQPRNEDEEFIINPAWNVGNSLMLITEGIKQSGFAFSKKTTDEGVNYLYVNAQDYAIAYYYNEDEVTMVLRIYDGIDKTKRWQEFYNEQVSKWPNLWSRTGDYGFKYESSQSKKTRYINLLRDFDENILVVEIK